MQKHRFMMRPSWVPVLALVLALPVAPIAAAAGVSVEKPWMRYLLPSIPAAGYMVLRNTGDSDMVLTAAASPACGMLMLHESRNDSGTSMMMDVQSITIPAHGSIRFAPAGYHLMCMQPSMKPGEKVPVTLRFKDGSLLRVLLPVYGAQNAP